MRVLLLGLGNDILGDDAVGLLAARALRGSVPENVEVLESSEAGLALVELLEGRDRALILDSVVTGRVPPGSTLEFAREDFRNVTAPSPHYAGLPEILELGERIGAAMPREVRVLAMEVENRYEVTEGLSDAVARSLPAFVTRAREALRGWEGGT